MSNAPSHIMDDDTEIPAEASSLEQAKELCEDYFLLVQEKESLEARLEENKEKIKDIERRQIPELFNRLQIDKMGLPEYNVDVVKRTYYHANIKTDWPEEQREKAFKWLEENDHGGVIAATLVVKFSREELPEARALEALIKTWPGSNSHPPKLEMGVPWNTLTSLIKTEVEAGEVVPLETLGATVGTTASIKKRKK